MNQKEYLKEQKARGRDRIPVQYKGSISYDHAVTLIEGDAMWDHYGDDLADRVEDAIGDGKKDVRFKKPIAVKGKTWTGKDAGFYPGAAYVSGVVRGSSDDTKIGAEQTLTILYEFTLGKNQDVKPLNRKMKELGAEWCQAPRKLLW